MRLRGKYRRADGNVRPFFVFGDGTGRGTMSDHIKERIRQEAKGGKLACKRALELARELGCAPAEVGKAADEEGIKIAGCQLGCFR
jgi:hypothetical protein